MLCLWYNIIWKPVGVTATGLISQQYDNINNYIVIKPSQRRALPHPCPPAIFVLTGVLHFFPGYRLQILIFFKVTCELHLILKVTSLVLFIRLLILQALPRDILFAFFFNYFFLEIKCVKKKIWECHVLPLLL